MSVGLPVIIFRPAIVIPTYKEPVCGWIDNMYGPTGIIVGVGSGLLRVLYAFKKNVAELVPADMCVNALLAAAWDLHDRRQIQMAAHQTNHNNNNNNNSHYNKIEDEHKVQHSEIFGVDNDSSRCDPMVYNYVASPQNPITWERYCDLGIEHGSKMPITKAIWHYRLTMASSKWLVFILSFFYHTIPGLLMDTGLLLMGKETK